MAKRFTSTEIWEEDWFLEMPNQHKLFWFYMLSNCDHAGFYKVNLRSFCSLLEVKVTTDEILKNFNSGKERITVVADGLWFIIDFFTFQYGHSFNINNPLHKGVMKQLEKYGIQISSIRGLKEVNLTTKDKEKDKEIKKGGMGENKIFAERISDDGMYAVFTDGTKQKLTLAQQSLNAMGELKADKIYQK